MSIIVNFPKDYNSKETDFVFIENVIVMQTLMADLCGCPMRLVRTPLKIIERTYKFNLSHTVDFKIAKIILINSVLYN